MCDGGKCFRCSPPGGQQQHQQQEHPVTRRWLDTAEDLAEDGRSCGVFPRHEAAAVSCSGAAEVCEGEVCLRCCPEHEYDMGRHRKYLIR